VQCSAVPSRFKTVMNIHRTTRAASLTTCRRPIAVGVRDCHYILRRIKHILSVWFVVLCVENFSYTSVKRDFAELPKQGELENTQRVHTILSSRLPISCTFPILEFPCRCSSYSAFGIFNGGLLYCSVSP